VFGVRVYEYFEVAVASELLDQLNVALARGVNKGFMFSPTQVLLDSSHMMYSARHVNFPRDSYCAT
jgi:hypothetical protein